MKEIQLSGGKGTVLVDDVDFEEMSKWKWCLREGYAARYVRVGEDHKTKNVSMHRIIARALEDEMVDHINQNRLDNRRANLRLCTQSQNTCNMKVKKTSKTQVKGVFPRKGDQYKKSPWRARVKKDGIVYLDRQFKTIEEAKAAYDACAREVQGEFSRS